LVELNKSAEVCGGVGDGILKKLFTSVHCHNVNVHIRFTSYLENLQILFIVVNATVLLLCVE